MSEFLARDRTLIADRASKDTLLVWNILKAPAQKAKPRIPEGMRIYAIGDIHGRADLLTELLSRIDAHLQAAPTPRPVQVFLGDYIDRGPDSKAVLDILINRRRQLRTLCLKGNHETYLVQFLNDPSALTDWRHVGGLTTIMSYGLNPSLKRGPAEHQELADSFRQALPESHLKFLEGLPLTYTCGDFFFTHAGVRPGVPLKQQSERDLLLIREDFLLHEEHFGKVVVHGHTPVMRPDIRPNRINIDTGAYATGRLTCLVLEGDRMSFL